MALKIALFAAVCVAQAFAFQPLSLAFPKDVARRNPGAVIAHTFDEAMDSIDEVRQTVSMAALNAYAKESNMEIIIACFRAQRDSFIKLRENTAEMFRNASEEMYNELRTTSEHYAELLMVPLQTMAKTMMELPEKVYNHLKNFQFKEAIEAMEDARRTIEENSMKVGELMQEMVGKVPQMTDKVMGLAMEIRNETKKGSDAIRMAFGKCVAEGGPKQLASEQ